MVAPAEIELQLIRHPAVRECAVLGVPDEILGEEIAAVVVASEPLKASELRRFLSSRLPGHMLPRFIGFAEALPKTETEKVKRHELARLLVDAIDLRPG